MFKTLKNAWAIADLRKKLIFTALIMLLFRLGSVVPVPFINVDVLSQYYNSVLSNTILGLYNAMSGSAFSQATVLALGIQPYINSSIIIQLLTIAIPALERLSKEGGEEGKKKIERITRFTTVGLGLLMGWAYYMMLLNYQKSGYPILQDTSVLPAIVIILAFAAGSTVVMWLGEQITEHGIGNGISMILFANIISRLPEMTGTTINMGWWGILVAVGVLALIVLIVFVNDAERRIPIQYAKRVVGRKVYGGQNTDLPIKVSMTGVMPIIFAQSIASLPATICAFIPGGVNSWVNKNLFDSTTWVYAVCYFLLIFFFGWFYASIQYDPVEISNNLKKNGGFIPGFRPGKPTADFIKKVINKIVVFGSLYLGVVALLPIIAGNAFPSVKELAIGGTSIIIVVSVALETVKALEAQMLMRHYKGFLD
ncbi:MAG: preprotein translocase subunit SecY [Oscillospiraceae bacterium]|nr:preprotein translocase subunit SecY [Oscillospiraceae bacterium]